MAPLFMIGPVWGAVLAVRLWRRAPGGVARLRRTHAVFLASFSLVVLFLTWKQP